MNCSPFDSAGAGTDSAAEAATPSSVPARGGNRQPGGRGWAGAPLPAAGGPLSRRGQCSPGGAPCAQRGGGGGAELGGGGGGPELGGGGGPRCRSPRLLPAEGERPRRLRDGEAKRVLNRVDGSRTASCRTRAVSGRGGGRGGLRLLRSAMDPNSLSRR